MLKFIKFILAVSSIFLLVFLINISFFSWIQISENKLAFLNDLEKIKDIEEFTLSWILETKKRSYVNNINFFDKIFYLEKDSFKLEDKKDNISIKLNSWVFIFDLNDLTKNYVISSDKHNFKIELKSVWNLYIDTSKDKILVFSINSSFVLNFLDKDNKQVNSYFMYPHEFIKFNYKLNFRYKNVDLYRIRTITKNGYFKYKLSEYSLNENKIVWLIWKDNLSFFSNYLESKQKKLVKNVLLYKKIISLKNSIFPFKYYIDKYSYYFINDSKKVIYLQNNIYNRLIELFISQENSAKMISEINNNLKHLKILNKNKFEEALGIINKFYKVLLEKHNIVLNKSLDSFIALKIDNSKIPDGRNYIELKNIYFNYDFRKFENSQEYFNKFLDFYLTKVWIKQENENFTLNKKEKLTEIESFVFFLREYMFSNLFTNNLEKIDSEIKILFKYINLNNMIYFSGREDSTKIRTSLVQNLELLKNLKKYLKNNFFEENREKETELLILNKNKVDFNSIKEFELQVNRIFKIFNENINTLNRGNNDKIISEYDKLSISFKEEFFAISDYDRYKLENDKKLKQLYALTTIWDSQIQKYSSLSISNYLSYFVWVKFNTESIFPSEDKKFFIIKKVTILDKIYDLHLYPSLWNIVKVLEKDTENLVASYDLDNIKELFREKYKWAKQEEKYKYDFKNFFKEKFKPIVDNSETSIYDKCYLENKISDLNGWCKEILNDSSAITVIKRDKLIWGEFKGIKDFFIIEYKDLSVNLEWKSFDIKIDWAEINSSIKQKLVTKKYLVKFSSNYDLEKHIFSSIILKVKDLKDDKNYLFGWANISFKFKNVEINNLKTFIDDFLIDMNNINSVYWILRWSIILSNLDIWYFGDKIYLKFENNWKDIIINVEWDKIASINKGGINILDKEINISDLHSILDKLK